MTSITQASGKKCQEDKCSSPGSASSDLLFRSYVGLNCSLLSQLIPASSSHIILSPYLHTFVFQQQLQLREGLE